MVASGPTAAEGLGANSGFVVGDDGVLVIDSRYTPRLANELLEAIRSVTNAPVTYVVNTHYHPDHAWGNMVFKAQGAVIVARPETRDALVKYSPAYFRISTRSTARTPTSCSGTSRSRRRTRPSATNAEIDLGGVKVVLRCTRARAYGGRLRRDRSERRGSRSPGAPVSNGYHPNMGDPGADFDNWIAALDRLGASKIRARRSRDRGRCAAPRSSRPRRDTSSRFAINASRISANMVPLEQAARRRSSYRAAEDVPPAQHSSVQRAGGLPARDDPRRAARFPFDLPAEFQIADGGGTRSSASSAGPRR